MVMASPALTFLRTLLLEAARRYFLVVGLFRTNLSLPGIVV